MQFYDDIDAVQEAYLAKALSTESPQAAVKIGDEIKAYSQVQEFKYAEASPVEITAKVRKKDIVNGVVKDEAPCLVTSDTGDFLVGEKKLYVFVTGALGADDRKPTKIESGGLLESIKWCYVTFKKGQNFMIKSKPVTVTMHNSAIDGKLYVESELPEQDQAKCLEKYKSEVKAERNARIADTDSYIQLTDVTVQPVAKAKRAALTDEQKEAIKEYRQALRDLPEQVGFPFVQFPELPECIAYECQQKIDQRNQQMGGLS